jgi:SAM-dependent MidA family methyltransferase
MCHYRQYAHDDPFFMPGAQDITAHVDFSAIAAAATQAGAHLLGYTSQAQFLINCGITDFLAQTPVQQGSRYLPLVSGVQKLTSPAEMGELFKVIAVGKSSEPLFGFRTGDRRRQL